MPLPSFEADGNLPEGIWRATLEEVVARFGFGTVQREDVTGRLLHIHELALNTDYLERFVIFGSYVTTKPAPNDVDICLVMAHDFDMDRYIGTTREVFQHEQADERFVYSVFWVTQKLGEAWIETLVDRWQNTWETTKRGIIEVTP